MHPYELMAKVCHLCMEQQRLEEPGTDPVSGLPNSDFNFGLRPAGLTIYLEVTNGYHSMRLKWPCDTFMSGHRMAGDALLPPWV